MLSNWFLIRSGRSARISGASGTSGFRGVTETDSNRCGSAGTLTIRGLTRGTPAVGEGPSVAGRASETEGQRHQQSSLGGEANQESRLAGRLR
jgi:hypothetical protein